MAMIKDMFDGGAMQTLERTLQFTHERHRLMVNNIANADTVHYRSKDIDPESFQDSLRRALGDRRRTGTPTNGKLEMRDTWEMRFREGGIDVRPERSNQNMLFHDRNNRDLERTMQQLAENTLAHNATVEMMRNQFDMIRTAIRERP